MFFRLLNKSVRFLLFVTIFCFVVFVFVLYTFNSLSCESVAQIELVLNERLHSVKHGRRKTAGPSKNITLFLAIKKEEDLLSEYRLAHRTLRCYCAMKNYSLIVVDFSTIGTMGKLCPQKDFMFRRHCVLSHWLADHPNVEWTLFMDADMAIINPNHLVEDHIPSDREVDLVFYERLFNGEIAAGSYLARNTEFTRNFLQYWANYYDKLPWSWHGTDNGAVHAVFMDYFCGVKDEIQCSGRRAICWQFWRTSANDDGLRLFTDCVHSVLGIRNKFRNGNGTVQLLTNFRAFWSRDGWLTGGKWCSRDFFLHGWKKKWQNSTKWGGWKSPLKMDEKQLEEFLNLTKCSSDSPPKWPYDNEYIASKNEIDTLLDGHLHEMRMTKLDYWRRVEEAEEKQGHLRK
ncbi:hypothetical protein niasHT_037005 [Heterodera trifolii]|uniref:Nucleotide-diphospho-sugar transferase domain-containing protein n=1 Tax=Heterodera trifolii TaxID=157864 RepID=A0ABD2IJ76_9BILA